MSCDPSEITRRASKRRNDPCGGWLAPVETSSSLKFGSAQSFLEKSCHIHPKFPICFLCDMATTEDRCPILHQAMPRSELDFLSSQSFDAEVVCYPKLSNQVVLHFQQRTSHRSQKNCPRTPMSFSFGNLVNRHGSYTFIHKLPAIGRSQFSISTQTSRSRAAKPNQRPFWHVRLPFWWRINIYWFSSHARISLCEGFLAGQGSFGLVGGRICIIILMDVTSGVGQLHSSSWTSGSFNPRTHNHVFAMCPLPVCFQRKTSLEEITLDCFSSGRSILLWHLLHDLGSFSFFLFTVRCVSGPTKFVHCCVYVVVMWLTVSSITLNKTSAFTTPIFLHCCCKLYNISMYSDFHITSCRVVLLLMTNVAGPSRLR